MSKTWIIVICLSLVFMAGCYWFNADNTDIPLDLNSENNNSEAKALPTDTKIAYIKDGMAWVHSFDGTEDLGLAPADQIAISPDFNYVAYTYTTNNQHYQTGAGPTGVYLYELDTGKIRHILERDTTAPLGKVSWSPDGKYLAIDHGTGVVREWIVYDVDTEDEKYRFTTTMSDFAWLEDDSIVFLELQRVDLDRPSEATSPEGDSGEGAEGRGISLIGLDSEVKRLRLPSNLDDYRQVEILPDGQWRFALAQVEDPDDWSDGSKITTIYGLTDESGQDLGSTDTPTDFDHVITELLPDDLASYQELYDLGGLPGDPDWRLFIINMKGFDTNDDEVYIVNIKDKGSLERIDQGTGADW